MQDLDRTFRSLDQLPTPDVWDEALAREPRTGPSPRPAHRLLTIVVALGVFAAAAFFAWRAFAPSVPPAGDNGRSHEGMGLRISVPDGWHFVSFATDWGPNPTSGFQVSNAVLPAPVAVEGAAVQASPSLPRNGVALVLYEGTLPGMRLPGMSSVDQQAQGTTLRRLATLPLATSDFAYGSAPAGAPTFRVVSFTGNGRTYVLTVTTGPNASSADQRAADETIDSIRWDPSSDLTIHQTLILDPPTDSRTFAPPNASPLLTAKQALVKFESVDGAFELPADSTIWLGTYTAAAGGGIYRFQDRLAYGIRYPQCIPPSNPFPVSPSIISCTRWLFLDADTGKMLEDVDQLHE